MQDLFVRVQTLLASLKCDIGAAESHGMLCGMLCGPARFDEQLWFQQVSGNDDISLFRSESASATAVGDQDFKLSTRGASAVGDKPSGYCV